MKLKMRYLLPIFLLFLLGDATIAQQQLTLRDAVLKAGTDLAPERLADLQWIEGTRSYSYIKEKQLWRGTSGKSADMPIVSQDDLNASLPEDKKLKGFPGITWDDGSKFHFMHGGSIHVFDLNTRKLSTRLTLPEDAEDLDLQDGTGSVAFTREDDLYVLFGSPEKEVRITKDGGNGIVNGKSVHRQEYGIQKGTFWSDDGSKLAFYRMDESMVTSYALEDITSRPSNFKQIRYPMAGAKSHHVTIGIFDVNSGKTVFLKTGEPLDQYLTNIAWDPSGAFIHVVHLDRKTENLKLVRYDATSGEPIATFLEEHDDKYLEPQHPIEFLPGRNKSRYLWRSQRDGWPHVYLYDVQAGLVRQLTRGNWVVKDVLAKDPSGNFIIVSGTLPIEKNAPLGATETHLYRVDVNTGKTSRITTDQGTHNGKVSTDGSMVIDNWSSLTVPNRVELLNSSGKKLKQLLDAKDPLLNYSIGKPELLTIAGEQGDQLVARMIKPSTFDPQRKYPVLIYVYNGPHVQLIANSRLANAAPWMYEAAERGYIVWTVDGHGSGDRGRDFEQVIHRRLGEVEVKDQMRGVEYLKSLPFVDPDRIAVHGWSYGGHMTTALLTRHPGVFKVGVAGGPVMDWGLYEVMYTERYMDTPEENPEGYVTTALPPLADKLQEDLLIITGGQDDVVPPQHAFSFIQECIAKGVQVDFFEYPGHAHNVRGKDRLHLMEKVLKYIDSRIQHQR
jgi:dipeptidyl-peptidase-4